METVTDIDWTSVVNLDTHGNFRGYSTAEDAEVGVEQAQITGQDVGERYTTDRAGLIIRVVRIADPEFLDTIYVFPAECTDCGAPVTSIKRVTDEHHAKCPRRDPYF